MVDIFSIQYPVKCFLKHNEALQERIHCPYLKGRPEHYQTHILRDASNSLRCVAEPRAEQPGEPPSPCRSCPANPTGQARMNPHSKKKRNWVSE